MLQWLRLHAFVAGGPDFIPSQGTKILQATRSGRKWGGGESVTTTFLTQYMWAFFPTPNNSPRLQIPTGYPVIQLHSDTKDSESASDQQV